MPTAKKEAYVSSLKDDLSSATTVVVAHYHGLDVMKINELRTQARALGVSIKITKNSLAKLAANDTKFDGLGEFFTGPTAIAYSSDAVAPAKTIVDFIKDNEAMQIVGGGMDDKVLDPSGVKALASMPSLDDSRAKLVGLLQAPASKLAAIAQAPAGQLARVFGAYGASEV